MVSEPFTRTAIRVFRAVEYEISFHGDSENLSISVEEREGARKWISSFPAATIERIARQTGNFKPFPIFVKMLLSALENGNPIRPGPGD